MFISTGADAFTGSNFYCESGVNSGGPRLDTYYLSDPLWDGLDCPTGNTCCDNTMVLQGVGYGYYG